MYQAMIKATTKSFLIFSFLMIGALVDSHAFAQENTDPVQKTLDNLGFQSWKPGESPEKLDQVLGGANIVTNKKRPYISTCLTIGKIEARYKNSAVYIATDLHNKCPEMISYFSKFQLFDDGFPESEEKQNSHTQIAANSKKTELLIYPAASLQSANEVRVQITSHDPHAYGTVSKTQSIDFASLFEAPTMAANQCFHNLNIEYKKLWDDETNGENISTRSRRSRRPELSLIISGQNTCDARQSVSASFTPIDAQSFALQSPRNITSASADAHTEFKIREVIDLPSGISLDEHAVLFEFFESVTIGSSCSARTNQEKIKELTVHLKDL